MEYLYYVYSLILNFPKFKNCFLQNIKHDLHLLSAELFPESYYLGPFKARVSRHYIAVHAPPYTPLHCTVTFHHEWWKWNEHLYLYKTVENFSQLNILNSVNKLLLVKIYTLTFLKIHIRVIISGKTVFSVQWCNVHSLERTQKPMKKTLFCIGMLLRPVRL